MGRTQEVGDMSLIAEALAEAKAAAVPSGAAGFPGDGRDGTTAIMGPWGTNFHSGMAHQGRDELAEGLGVEAVALHNLTCECSNGCNEYQDIPGIININMFTVSICLEVLYHRVCVCVPSLHLHLPSFQMYRMYLYHFILLVSSAITDPCQRCRLPHR